MLFNSYIFLLGFLPSALVAFFGVGKTRGLQPALSTLALFSLGFYAWWNPANLRVIVPSILINFAIGHALTSTAGEAGAERKRRALATVGIALNLLALGYFKYTDFLIDTVQYVTRVPLPLRKIALPLGISFFTFEQIAYVVDSYRGRSRAYSFREYCVFVTFFPHLIAGPIIQHDEMLNQLSDKTRKLSWDNVALGFSLLIIGLFKKVVLADPIAGNVARVYDAVPSGLTPSMFDAWLATVSYSLQLYFDFSGYSDMAIGLARIVNIRLPANFNSPYQSHNIIEFWRRWHMTLSRFLRNYLYIPLGGNRGSPFRRYLNLLLTMLLGGLWHGAGWGFVIWGGLNGIYLVINNLFRSFRGAPKDNAPEGPRWLIELTTTWTFLLVMLSRVFFRSEGWHASLVMLKSLFGLATLGLGAGLRSEGKTVFLLAALYLFCRLAPNSQQVLAAKQPVFEPVRAAGRWQLAFTPSFSFLLGAMAVASLLMLTNVSEFLYFQF